MPEKPKRKVKVQSTTLRDGLQTASTTHVSIEDRISIAEKEEAMGVDISEAGFPGVKDANSVQVIEEVGKNTKAMVIAAMSGWEPDSIDVAMDALKNGGAFLDRRGQLNVLTRPSSILRKYGLRGISRDDFLRGAENTAKYVVRRFSVVRDRDNVMVPPRILYYSEQGMDTYYEDPEFLAESNRILLQTTFEEAIKLGYKPEEPEVALSLCDTNGVAILDDYGKMFRFVREKLSGSFPFELSTHVHNDVGNAVASTISAVALGDADRVEVTINGIGEASGNADMASVLAQIHKYSDKLGVYTTIDIKQMTEAAKMVAAMVEPDGRLLARTSVTGYQVSAYSTTAGLHSAAEQAALREALVKRQEAGDNDVEAVQVYRALKASEWGNDGETFVGPEQGRDSLRRALDELHVFVGHELFEKLFTELRTGYKQGRNVEEYLRQVLCTRDFVLALDAEESLSEGMQLHLIDMNYIGRKHFVHEKGILRIETVRRARDKFLEVLDFSTEELKKIATGRADYRKLAETVNRNIAGLRGRLVSEFTENGQNQGEQEVKIRVRRKNGDEKTHEFEKTARATGGPIDAAVKALQEVTDFNFDIRGYMEQAVGIDEDTSNGHGAGAEVVATVVIKDEKGRKRRGFGIGKDSVFAKVNSIVNALNRLEWEKDTKGKSIPPKSQKKGNGAAEKPQIDAQLSRFR
jgi:2-isopropylmalate synthase